MVITRLTNVLVNSALKPKTTPNIVLVRYKPHFRSGALKPMPEVVPFGLMGIFGTVCLGLFIGATISKNIANFLEENDLFVPSDDDDDDD